MTLGVTSLDSTCLCLSLGLVLIFRDHVKVPHEQRFNLAVLVVQLLEMLLQGVADDRLVVVLLGDLQCSKILVNYPL